MKEFIMHAITKSVIVVYCIIFFMPITLLADEPHKNRKTKAATDIMNSTENPHDHSSEFGVQAIVVNKQPGELDDYTSIDDNSKYPFVSRGENDDYYAVVTANPELGYTHEYVKVYKSTGDPSTDPWQCVQIIFNQDYAILAQDIELISSNDRCHVLYIIEGSGEYALEAFWFQPSNPLNSGFTTVHEFTEHIDYGSLTSDEVNFTGSSVYLYAAWSMGQSDEHYIKFKVSMDSGLTWTGEATVAHDYSHPFSMYTGNGITYCPGNDMIFICLVDFDNVRIATSEGPFGSGPWSSQVVSSELSTWYHAGGIVSMYGDYILATYNKMAIETDKLRYVYSDDGGVTWSSEYEFNWGSTSFVYPSCAANDDGLFSILLHYRSYWGEITRYVTMRNNHFNLSSTSAWEFSIIYEGYISEYANWSSACIEDGINPRWGGAFCSNTGTISGHSYFGWAIPTAHLFTSYTIPIFVWTPNQDPIPPPQPLVLSNQGDTTMTWYINENIEWLFLEPEQGFVDPGGIDTVMISVGGTWPGQGIYIDTLAIMAPYTLNTPQELYVTLYCVDAPLTLEVIPDTTTIQIPPEGGVLEFQVVADNSTAVPYSFDFWSTITKTNGQQTSPLLGPLYNVSIGPNVHFVSTSKTQVIPSWAPDGVYSYNIFAGLCPDSVYAFDNFYFEKIESGENQYVSGEWPVSDNYIFVETNPSEHQKMESIHITAHPNPFNPTTAINFVLPVASLVKLDVFDINGRKVNLSGSGATPTTGFYSAGSHQITFNGTGLPSGIYIYRLTAGDFTGTGKMVLMK
ncbi:hypothetical protein CEE37_00645 [candidate division LCP-89 bacterium B3_LCP]|uniref:Secretion system C-terminal sorting domain-containing protein n=1 Tax=candidate division LCP-89 bacterium B3_LCP TaxID=2012998 RepID=A0A532V5G4_UNCL8|nr:MAG: hypothetical protein CEE37_00645 [candidate division LCP-89 bacterium B3_LCP]